MKTESIQLVILAAGLGSRFGGLKQITPMGINGDWLLSFSLWDAWESGIRRVVLIIREEIHEDFEKLLLVRLHKYFEVQVVYQRSESLPCGLSNVIQPRQKPWGTAHALWCAKDVIDDDFMVINADDYYGRNAFEVLLEGMASSQAVGKIKTESKTESGAPFAWMLGYPIGLTLSDNGGVSRGICQIDDKHFLKEIVETTGIVKENCPPDDQTLVSMNIWGFKKSFLGHIEKYIVNCFSESTLEQIETLECYLPSAVAAVMTLTKGQVKVQKAKDKWLGVTYQGDYHGTADQLQAYQKQKLYPMDFWK